MANSRTRTVRSKRQDRIRLGDFRWIELEHEIIEHDVPADESKQVHQNLKDEIKELMMADRKEVKKAFNKGQFEV